MWINFVSLHEEYLAFPKPRSLLVEHINTPMELVLHGTLLKNDDLKNFFGGKKLLFIEYLLCAQALC